MLEQINKNPFLMKLSLILWTKDLTENACTGIQWTYVTLSNSYLQSLIQLFTKSHAVIYKISHSYLQNLIQLFTKKLLSNLNVLNECRTLVSSGSFHSERTSAFVMIWYV